MDPNELVERNVALVYHIINKKFPGAPEDYYAVGMLGLVKGSRHYDPEKSKEATFLSRCIINEVLMMLGREKKHRVVVGSIDNTLYEDGEGNIITFSDVLAAPTDVQKEVELRLMYKAAVAASEGLSYKERQALLSICHGKTQKEVAKEIGCEQSYVARLRQVAASKVRKVI